jgi:hypothetical protein
MVLMQVVSNGCRSDLIPGLGSTAVAIDAFLCLVYNTVRQTVV